MESLCIWVFPKCHTTPAGRRMRQIGSINSLQCTLQWFIRLPLFNSIYWIPLPFRKNSIKFLDVLQTHLQVLLLIMLFHHLSAFRCAVCLMNSDLIEFHENDSSRACFVSLWENRTLQQINSRFPIIHKVIQLAFFVLLGFKNRCSCQSYYFISKHHDKCKICI